MSNRHCLPASTLGANDKLEHRLVIDDKCKSIVFKCLIFRFSLLERSEYVRRIETLYY